MTTVCARWFWTGAELLERVELTLRGGAIARIQGDLCDARLSGAAKHRLLLPGLVNAHSHAFQRAFRGHVQRAASGRDDFWSWRERMYAVAATIGPDALAAVSQLCFVEMAQAGITTAGEFHYLQRQPGGVPYADPDELALRVIGAGRDAGLRVVLLRCAYARGSFDTPAVGAQLRFVDDDPADVLRAAERLMALPDPLVTAGIAPHSVRAVPGEWLTELARWPGIVHAHVSEQPAEVAACRAATGTSPLAWLAEHGLLSDRFTAVHMTWPEPGDIDLLVAAGAAICVCPSTELDLGDGFLPLAARRARLCLGSDSHARIDLFAEARALELHGRGLAGHRNVLLQDPDATALAAHVLRAATLDGRRALGLQAEPLVIGSAADLCALDLHRPAAIGVPPLCAAAFGATPEWVTDTWIGGRHVVRQGRHFALEATLSRAADYLAGLCW